MRLTQSALLLFLLPAVLTATFSPRAQETAARPTMAVRTLDGALVLDGELNDLGWQTAASVSDFTQYAPIDRVKPKVRTKVWMTYDQSHLYLAFYCEDAPASIRSTLTDRDRMYDDDFVGLILDTYGDGAWAYEFYVNPRGVQGDLRWLASGDEDPRFDVVYATEAKVTDSGWQAEMAIPFSSLRFPEAEEQAWRASFWRSHPRDKVYKYSWAPIEQGTACFFCEFGYLTGIRGVAPGSKLDLLPAVVASQSGVRDPDDLARPFENFDPDAEGELNVRYRLSGGLTAEATVNPDFSQIESDAQEVDVNSTFALFYPERRPFFQEGGDLYGTYIGAVYTRAINDPEAALKLTGRQGRTSFFALSASDDNSPLFIPLEERTEFVPLGKTYSNLGRVRRTIGDDSHIGALVTDRRLDAGDGSNTVYGVDGAVRLFKQYRFEAQALASHSRELNAPELSAVHLNDTTFDDGTHTLALDGETYDGLASYASLERDGRLWSFNYDYYGTSPTFRADNGFITRAGTHLVDLWNGFMFRPDGRVVTRLQPAVSVGRVWDWNGRIKDEWVRTMLDITLTGQTVAGGSFLLSRERLRTVWFDDIRMLNLWAETAVFDRFRFGAEIDYGNSIARNVVPLPVMGRQLATGVWSTFKPVDQFTIVTEWEYVRMRNRDTGEGIFEGYVLRNRVNYQFTRKVSARVIVQYDDFDDRLSVEPLLTYKIHPFTIFYLGSASRYAWATDGEDLGGKLIDRQFFVKLQYLFRM